MYILGAANVGKSTLVNRLIARDLLGEERGPPKVLPATSVLEPVPEISVPEIVSGTNVPETCVFETVAGTV